VLVDTSFAAEPRRCCSGTSTCAEAVVGEVVLVASGTSGINLEIPCWFARPPQVEMRSMSIIGGSYSVTGISRHVHGIQGDTHERDATFLRLR
jgi:hypothetical protein